LKDNVSVVRRIVLFIIVLAYLAPTFNGLKAQPVQSSERDLSHYDKIGPFNVDEPSLSLSARIRDFI
jgi:hypothetical protein